MTTTAKTQKPITKKQFDAAKARYAENSAKSKTIIDKSEAKIKELTDKRHTELGNMPAQMEEDFNTIMQYCTDNREELFGEAKSIPSECGTLVFRTGKHAVVLAEDVDQKELIATMKKKGLDDYLVTKTELNKNQIIADRDDEKLMKQFDKLGVTVEQGETFSIK